VPKEEIEEGEFIPLSPWGKEEEEEDGAVRPLKRPF